MSVQLSRIVSHEVHFVKWLLLIYHSHTVLCTKAASLSSLSRLPYSFVQLKMVPEVAIVVGEADEMSKPMFCCHAAGLTGHSSHWPVLTWVSCAVLSWPLTLTGSGDFRKWKMVLHHVQTGLEQPVDPQCSVLTTEPLSGSCPVMETVHGDGLCCSVELCLVMLALVSLPPSYSLEGSG